MIRCGICNEEVNINTYNSNHIGFFCCKCRESFYYLVEEEIINCILYINKEIRFNYWESNHICQIDNDDGDILYKISILRY
jgi:hypothetical protein